MTEHDPALPGIVTDSPSPNLNVHVKGAVPLVYVALKVSL